MEFTRFPYENPSISTKVREERGLDDNTGLSLNSGAFSLKEVSKFCLPKPDLPVVHKGHGPSLGVYASSRLSNNEVSRRLVVPGVHRSKRYVERGTSFFLYARI